MAPRPYCDKSSLPSNSKHIATGIPIQVLSETPSSNSSSTGNTTLLPAPAPGQEEVLIETYEDSEITQESNRISYIIGSGNPCYPTPGDIMPYDHSLPDFIKQITNQSNLANLQSLSLRVISTLLSLHRMSSYLPNLRELDLEGSVLSSLRDIGCNFKNLQILKVGRCQLESLDGTFGLSSLRELYAQKNFINDVSPCSNLPHIRHIDVSGNRIRNISYAGFLSVCSKLKSIVFTGNPATETSDYRKHVRRILPQVEELDGIPFVNEENKEETKETETIENCCEGSDSSSTGIPDFLSASPSDSMNNFFDSEEDLFVLDKKNKHAKNMANQDHFDVCGYDTQEVLIEIKNNLVPDEDFQNLSFMKNKEETKINFLRTNGYLEKAKFIENKSNLKQKCTSIQKLDKDIENRTKKSNLLLNINFVEESSHNGGSAAKEEKTSASITRREDSNILSSAEKEPESPLIRNEGMAFPLNDLKAEAKFGAIRKRSTLSTFKSTNDEEVVERNLAPGKLTTGLPVCGNLTAALRNRKKCQSAWNENQEEKDDQGNTEPLENKKLQVKADGSGNICDIELGVEKEDVLITSRKWRETFRRFRTNNRNSSAEWEKEDIFKDVNLLEEPLEPVDTSESTLDEKPKRKF